MAGLAARDEEKKRRRDETRRRDDETKKKRRRQDGGERARAWALVISLSLFLIRTRRAPNSCSFWT
jgi:hypothetical protein